MLIKTAGALGTSLLPGLVKKKKGCRMIFAVWATGVDVKAVNRILNLKKEKKSLII